MTMLILNPFRAEIIDWLPVKQRNVAPSFAQLTPGSRCSTQDRSWDHLRFGLQQQDVIEAGVGVTPTSQCKKDDASILKTGCDIYFSLHFDLFSSWVGALSHPPQCDSFFCSTIHGSSAAHCQFWHSFSLGSYSACLVLCLVSISLQGCQSGIVNMWS